MLLGTRLGAPGYEARLTLSGQQLTIQKMMSFLQAHDNKCTIKMMSSCTRVSVPDPKPTPAQITFSIVCRGGALYCKQYMRQMRSGEETTCTLVVAPWCTTFTRLSLGEQD